MSIATAIGSGLGIITQLANLRNTIRPPSVGGTIAGQIQLGQILQGQVPSLPAMPGSGFTTGGRLTSGGVVSGGGMPMQGPPAGYHWARDGSGRIVRNRRMNPLNPSAARRAIRRIKGARKMLQSIERSLPKRAAPKSIRKR